MPTASPVRAYPRIQFRWRSVNWWARLTRVPPECVHLENDFSWMATYAPDTIYLQGKARRHQNPARPEVSLCRACLLQQMETELASYRGRVVAFEPNGADFSQYFFVGATEFAAAGLLPQVGEAITARLNRALEPCETCGESARWIWFTRAQVQTLDDVGSIASAHGHLLCAAHGAERLCSAFRAVGEANLMYVNVPYGESGAYLWI